MTQIMNILCRLNLVMSCNFLEESTHDSRKGFLIEVTIENWKAYDSIDGIELILEVLQQANNNYKHASKFFSTIID